MRKHGFSQNTREITWERYLVTRCCLLAERRKTGGLGERPTAEVWDDLAQRLLADADPDLQLAGAGMLRRSQLEALPGENILVMLWALIEAAEDQKDRPRAGGAQPVPTDRLEQFIDRWTKVLLYVMLL